MSKKFTDVEFPIFPITGQYGIEYIGGATYATREGIVPALIDDTSLEGNTLGLRRLQAAEGGLLLLRLPISFSCWKSVIGNKARLFIDNSGYTFIYKPSRRMRIKYYKVKTQVTLDNGAIAYIEGSNIPIRLSASLEEGTVWYLGLGFLDGEPVLFDISDEPKKSTWRKV